MTSDEFRTLRAITGLTQPEFAAVLGVERNAVARAEAEGPSEGLIVRVDWALSLHKIRVGPEKLAPERG